jgi:nucleoside-diphosphate-sugar epimerase
VAKNIIDLTYKVVDITLKCNAKLLYVSSSEIYGHSGIHSETEEKHVSSNTGTRTEYALGKLTSEIILQNLNFNNSFRFNIVRPFNVVGAQQSSKIGFVFPSFFENALKNQDITVFYDGLQKRSFCHVDDIVSAMVCIQESGIIHEIFNIGNDHNTTTILDLARRIREICHSGSEIIHIDPVRKYGKCYLEAFDKIPNIDKLTSIWDET